MVKKSEVKKSEAKKREIPQSTVVVLTALGLVAGGIMAVYGVLAVQFGPLAGGWVAPLAVALAACATAWVMFWRGRQTKAVVVAILLVVLFVISLGVPIVGPRWASANTYDGTSPTKTGCAEPETSEIIHEWTVHETDTEYPIATVRLMHSTVCSTSWVRVMTSIPDATTSKWIARPAGDWLWESAPAAVTDPPTDQWTFGVQVYAPGCVDTEVVVTVADEEVGATKDRICSGGPVED